jgi:hypothetical protein
MWALLLACQAPFGTDRHDLAGFRLAAVSFPPTPTGEVGTPQAAVVVDGRTWVDDPVDLRWYWVANPDAVVDLSPETAPDGFGPSPSLIVPQDRRTLAVIAAHGEEDLRAFIEVAEPPATLGASFTLTAQSLPISVESAEGPELLLEARGDLTPEPLAEVQPGDFVRWTAEVTGDPLVRWMATAGTFFEFDRSVTDWAAGDLTLDQDEIEDGRTVLGPGPVTFLALALGSPGETQFTAFDLEIGPRRAGVVVNGRIVPTDPPVSPAAGDWVVGTLTADDTAPAGIMLTEAAVVAAGSVPVGTDALPCAVPLDGPFDPRVLLTTVCVRVEIEGYEVAVVAEGAW